MEDGQKFMTQSILNALNAPPLAQGKQINVGMKPKTNEGMVSNFAQQDWQQKIYEGLVINNTSTKVSKGSINRPIRGRQISEPMTSPLYEIAADNFRNRGLKMHSREKFIMGRNTAFMPQE